MFEAYEVSGLGEIDGLYDGFFIDRIPDLMPIGDGFKAMAKITPFRRTRSRRADAKMQTMDEPYIHSGTCPLCNNLSFHAHSIKGVWHCEICNQGGGVVALQFLMNPDKYGNMPPVDGWEMAARDVLMEQVALLNEVLEQLNKEGRNHADLA